MRGLDHISIRLVVGTLVGLTAATLRAEAANQGAPGAAALPGPTIGMCFASWFSCPVNADSIGQPCSCASIKGLVPGRIGPADDQALGDLLQRTANVDLTTFTFEVFKKSDLPKVSAALNLLDVDIVEKDSKVAQDQTDAILFTRDVPPDVIRLVALALDQQGIKLRGLRQYGQTGTRPLPARRRLIQIVSLGFPELPYLSKADLLSGPIPSASGGR